MFPESENIAIVIILMAGLGAATRYVVDGPAIESL
jgi:hypothetical protein